MAGLIVEVFRGAAERDAHNRFSCPLAAWDLLWELGLAFGWRPKGTTYVMPPRSRVITAARRDYQPGSSLDHKHVEEEDALAWSQALELAKISPHAAAMIEARSQALAGNDQPSGGLPRALLDTFVAFAAAGAFEFAILEEQHDTRQGGS